MVIFTAFASSYAVFRLRHCCNNIVKLWCVMGQRLKALCSSSGVSEQSGGSNPGCDTCVPEEDVFHHN